MTEIEKWAEIEFKLTKYKIEANEIQSVFEILTLSIRISLRAIFLIEGSSSVSLNFLIATMALVSRFLDLKTVP